MNDSKPQTPRVRKPAPKRNVIEAKEHEGDRIAKVMARAGLCSRRDAELWIEQGRVAVNGEVLTSAARNVTETDKILVDGRPLATRERTRLFLFHKPRGLVTTDRDPEGRATVFEYIAEKYPELPRLMSVGRLDINTEGLLLLTNDGGLARVLELPATGWLRRYRARANGVTDQDRLDTLKNGVTIDGIDYAGVDAKLDRVQGANVWISLGLREGKNREVKKLLEHLALGVNRLIRLSYGPFQLGEMEDGSVEEVKTRILIDQLGPKLAEEAGADFEGPIFDNSPEPEERPAARAPRATGAKPAPRARKSEAVVVEKPGPRKHVTALRNERVKAEKGPRRRVEKTATADRKGRAVVVERVSVARKAEEAPDNRNARRFRAEREGGESDFAPRKPRMGSEAGAAKLFRRNADGPAKPRGERSFGDDKRAPRSDRPRSDGPRSEGRAERPRFDKPRADGPRTERPRSDGPRTERPRFDKPRSEGSRSERPRSDGPRSEGRPERPRFDKPRADGPRTERPRFDKPRSAGPRSAGPRSEGPRSEGPRSDKPRGDRPSGGRPGGGKPGPRKPRDKS